MRRKGIVGPVAMITVGTLFLMQEFTRYDFNDTWPVLLIAIGIAMFVQRSYREPYSGAGAQSSGSQSTPDKVNHG